MIEDFAKEDISYLNDALVKTKPLEGDALKRLLQFVQEFIDMFTDLSEPLPGCLYATYLSETDQFDEEIKEFISTTILNFFLVLIDKRYFKICLV